MAITRQKNMTAAGRPGSHDPATQHQREAAMTTLSRRMAYVLRHHPESVGIELDPIGAVGVGLLARALGVEAADIVAASAPTDKPRFALEDNRVRACHGHSVAVAVPHTGGALPPTLYHGTTLAAWSAITREGLAPMGRIMVHLSESPDIARTVAARRGGDTLLAVDVARAEAEGVAFTQSAPGIWLCDAVPAAAIDLMGVSRGA